MKLYQRTNNEAAIAKRLFLAVVFCILTISAAFAQTSGYNWDDSKQLYPGIKYANVKVAVPRILNVSCLQIDTYVKGLRFYTTPPHESWVNNESETIRKSTRDFIRESQNTDKKLVIAINADFFTPWPAPWNQQLPANLVGLAVSEGRLVSPSNGNPSFVVYKNGNVRLTALQPDSDISNIANAVSGSGFVLNKGLLISGGSDLHPRTAVGIDKGSRYVYFMTIDGRQEKSTGATEQEIGTWLKYFGAYNGINLDGGGSTNMAWWDPDKKGKDKAVLLNLALGTSKPTENGSTERTVGNNIGVYFTAE